MNNSFGLKKMVGRSVILLASLICLTAPGNAEKIKVVADHAKIFKLENPVSTVIVGNPSIADATIHDDTTVILTGKGYGETNVVFLDENSAVVSEEIVSVSARTANLVNLYRGIARQSYNCDLECEVMLRPGDASGYNSGVATAFSRRNQLASESGSF